MSDKKPFTVGDEVTVLSRGRAIALRRVVKVSARYVALNDESRWNHEGDPYPRERYPQRDIAHTKPEHVAYLATVKGARMLLALAHAAEHGITIGTIEPDPAKVRELLRAFEAAFPNVVKLVQARGDKP